jgi:hypothetical protein
LWLVLGIDTIVLQDTGLFRFDDDGGQTEAGEIRLFLDTGKDQTVIISDQTGFEVFLTGNLIATLTEGDFVFA